MAYNFDTLKIRAGYNPLEHNNAVSVPIYQTVAYEMGSTARADALFAFELEDPLYTRVSNPTVQVLEKRVAALHGVDYAVAVASGMAAISYTVLALAAKGGRILTSPRLYDPDDPQEFERNIKEDTKAIYIETISNPLATVLDFDAIAEIAHKHGIPLIVDNTAATPYLFNPFEHGADIVVYSATKALCGHGNVIAGIVLEKGGFNYDPAKFPILDRKLWFLRDRNENPRSILDIFPVSPVTGKIRAVHLNYLGAALSPFDAYLILLGIETLSERVAKQTSSAVKIVKYLETNKHVNWISYPYASSTARKNRSANSSNQSISSATRQTSAMPDLSSLIPRRQLTVNLHTSSVMSRASRSTRSDYPSALKILKISSTTSPRPSKKHSLKPICLA